MNDESARRIVRDFIDSLCTFFEDDELCHKVVYIYYGKDFMPLYVRGSCDFCKDYLYDLLHEPWMGDVVQIGFVIYDSCFPVEITLGAVADYLALSRKPMHNTRIKRMPEKLSAYLAGRDIADDFVIGVDELREEWRQAVFEYNTDCEKCSNVYGSDGCKQYNCYMMRLLSAFTDVCCEEADLLRELYELASRAERLL